jgi:hypothetical protein
MGVEEAEDVDDPEEWRRLVDTARSEYETCKAAAARALERIDCRAGNLEIQNLIEAQRREDKALREYMRVLWMVHQAHRRRPD